MTPRSSERPFRPWHRVLLCAGLLALAARADVDVATDVGLALSLADDGRVAALQVADRPAAVKGVGGWSVRDEAAAPARQRRIELDAT
ncbi:MAG: hypothetical protein HYU66_09985, partial [Armatimonadetes bacterium]|nr:hypothetical protein [Armatimonadota bacterium]